jgi:hypothetical protein
LSDNPGGDNEELASLGIEFDSQAFAASLDAAKQTVADFGTSAAESMSKATEAANTLLDTINAQAEAFKNEDLGTIIAQQDSLRQGTIDQTTAMQAQIDKINELADAYRNEASAATQTAQYDAAGGSLVNGQYGGGAQNIGYGETGGMIGPAEDDGSGGGGGGSLFGAAHGIRAASGLANMAGLGGAGTQALTGGADILYLTKGLQSISDLLPQLNAAIETTPGLLAPLVDGLTAMGVGMAGIAALALPVVAVIAAIAGIVAVLKALQEQADLAASGLERQVKNEDDYNKLTTENSDQANADLTKNQQTIESNKQKIDDLRAGENALIDDQVRKNGGNVNDPVAHNVAHDEIQGSQGYQDAEKKIKDLQDQTQQLGDLDNTVYAARVKGSGAAADAAAAQAKAEQDLIDKGNQVTALAKEHAQLSDLTSAAAAKRLNDLKGEQEGLEASNKVLQDGTDKSATVTAAITANNKALADNAEQQNYLTSTVIPADKALDDQTETTKALAQAAKDAAAEDQKFAALIQQSSDTYTKYLQDEADAKDKEAKAEQQYTIGFDADTNARLDIATKESRQETQIKQAMADADADIRAKLQDNLAQANTGLARQLEDDTTKYNNDRAKAVRDEQDTENEDLESHLQKLADIQNQAHNSDQQALLDRNFLQLAKNKESGDQQVSQENERYNNQIDDLREHLTNSQRDQQIAYQQEEQQQTLAEERKRDDLELAAQQAWTAQQTNEERKLATQRTAEQQQLDDLTTTEQRKLVVLRQGLQDELALLQTQEQQRMAIIQASINDLTNPPSQTYTSAGQKKQVPVFAGGGGFNAGDPFVFNEPGSSGFEQVNIGSTSFGSNTAALVIPFGSGNVNPNSGGGGQSIVLQPIFQISGASNPDQIVNLAVGKLQDMLEGVIKP